MQSLIGLSPTARKAAIEKARREKARRHLLDFATYTFPGYEVNWHHRSICRKIEQMIYGDLRRLILAMPPRAGKTELVSRRLPAFLFGLNPDTNIIATSYSADLASGNNRDVQRVIDTPLYRNVFPGVGLYGKNIKTSAQGAYLRNSDIFEIVNHRGMYRSAGRGGAITGKGGEWLIIDDPIKDREEAESSTIRESLWDWYTSTLYSRRANDDARIIVVQTRWHEDDLVGRLLKQSKENPNLDQWEEVRYTAMPESEEDLTEDDPREIGEPLWPTKFSKEDVEKTKSMDAYTWASLYQQRPAPRGGGRIKLHWFKRYSTPPIRFVRIIQSWDTAQEANELNAPWVCGTWGEAEGSYYLLDLFVKRMEYPEGKRMAASLALRWNPNMILIEKKSTGASLLQEMQEGIEVDGIKRHFSVIPIDPTNRGSKVVRMDVETPAIESGRIYLPEFAPWLPEYENRVSTFPNCITMDEIDMTSQFLRWVREHPLMSSEPASVGPTRNSHATLKGY